MQWKNNERNEQYIICIGDDKLKFVLTISRNTPLDFKAHFRLKGKNVQLARVDSQAQHINPDGTKITGPHMHMIKKGHLNCEWAEEIQWYDASDPVKTLLYFLDLIKTKFPYGIFDASLQEEIDLRI